MPTARSEVPAWIRDTEQQQKAKLLAADSKYHSRGHEVLPVLAAGLQQFESVPS